MKSLGYLLLVAGLFLGGYALTLDTSVEVNYSSGDSFGLPDRVNNIGLMDERRNYLIFSGILTIVGLIMILSGKKEEVIKAKEEAGVTNTPLIISNEAKYDDLEKLGKLLEKGIITREEFEAEKKKILAKPNNTDLAISSVKVSNIDEEVFFTCKKIQAEIKKAKAPFYLGYNNELIGILEGICYDQEASANLIDSYEYVCKDNLITSLCGLTANYDGMKKYLSSFIERGIVDESYPHRRLK